MYIFRKEFRKNIFFISAVFLPSALPISAFLLLIIIISFLLKDLVEVKKNALNYLIIVTILIMFISAIYSFLNFDNEITSNFLNESLASKTDKNSILLDLFNWIPVFLLFWASQKYLKDFKDRIKFAKCLFIGTMPVIISCVLQYWFKLYGPFEFLYGTIIWFQKPIEEVGGISGLFSNPNYTGSWLTAILPFSLFLIIKNKNNLYRRLILSFITIFHCYVIVLTNSRNAFIGMFITLSLIFGFKGLFLYLQLLTIFLIFLSTSYFIDITFFKSIFNQIVSNPIIDKFLNIDFSNISSSIRIDTISRTLYLIPQKPIWGFGSGTYPIIYELFGGNNDLKHTHNLILQLAFDYGVPTALLIMFITTYLFANAFYKTFFTEYNSNLIDKCWVISTSIGLIYNFTDITYYDGKINILNWILLAGLNNIIYEKRKDKILKV